jgi:multisubunit Na+/H+ antiporter MnhG subunit
MSYDIPKAPVRTIPREEPLFGYTININNICGDILSLLGSIPLHSFPRASQRLSGLGKSSTSAHYVALQIHLPAHRSARHIILER